MNNVVRFYLKFASYALMFNFLFFGKLYSRWHAILAITYVLDSELVFLSEAAPGGGRGGGGRFLRFLRRESHCAAAAEAEAPREAEDSDLRDRDLLAASKTIMADRWIDRSSLSCLFFSCLPFFVVCGREN